MTLNTAGANDECMTPQEFCVLHVEDAEVCGVNHAIQGETCVRHVRAVVGVPTAPGTGPQVVVDHESSDGEVRALHTENVWTSQTTTVGVRGVPAQPVLGVYGYVSASQPGGNDAGQADAYVFGPVPGGSPVAGVRLLLWNLEPLYCSVYTPLGVYDAECRLTPVYELVPVLP